MPWFKEEKNKHPEVFFRDRNDFWEWRAGRPFHGDRRDPEGEIWLEVDQRDEGELDGRLMAPLPLGGAMIVNEPVENINLNFPLGNPVKEIDLGGWQMRMPPAPPVEERDEAREWADLTTEEKLDWLLAQPDSLPIWKEIQERIQYWKDEALDDRYQEGYDRGWDDAKDDMGDDD